MGNKCDANPTTPHSSSAIFVDEHTGHQPHQVTDVNLDVHERGSHRTNGRNQDPRGDRVEESERHVHEEWLRFLVS